MELDKEDSYRVGVEAIKGGSLRTRGGAEVRGMGQDVCLGREIKWLIILSNEMESR